MVIQSNLVSIDKKEVTQMRKTVDLIEKLNDNEVAVYLDEYGLLHTTEWMDDASQNGE